MEIVGQSLVQPSQAGGHRQRLDERCGGDEASGEAVLDSAICDGDDQMGFAAAAFSLENQAASSTDELRAEIAAQERQPQAGLEREVELIDGLQEREVCLSDRALDTGLLAMSDFLGDQHPQELPT